MSEQEQEIARLKGEVSELLAASDADTMLIRNMDRELTSTKASLGRAEGERNTLRYALTLAEWSKEATDRERFCPICGAGVEEGHDDQCELKAALAGTTPLPYETCECRDMTDLRAALGKVVGALRSWLRLHENVPAPLCSGGFGDPACICADCNDTRAVLTDPAGQQAGREWAARVEVAQKAVAYLESQDKNLMAAIVTVGGGQKKEAKIRALEMQACREALQDALRRLEEVQNG